MNCKCLLKNQSRGTKKTLNKPTFGGTTLFPSFKPASVFVGIQVKAGFCWGMIQFYQTRTGIAKLCYQGGVVEDSFEAQLIHHGKTEHINKTKRHYTKSSASLAGKDFKADWGFKMLYLSKCLFIDKKKINICICGSILDYFLTFLQVFHTCLNIFLFVESKS